MVPVGPIVQFCFYITPEEILQHVNRSAKAAVRRPRTMILEWKKLLKKPEKQKVTILPFKTKKCVENQQIIRRFAAV